MNLDRFLSCIQPKRLQSMLLVATVLISLFAQYALADLDPIIIKGQHLFYQNGTQFFVRGVYNFDGGRQKESGPLGGIDMLSNEAICARDIPYLTKLGINTILAGDINPKGYHGACMRLYAAAGIYVLVMLNSNSTPQSFMNNGKLNKPNDYTQNEYFEAMVDIFHEYPNTMGFFVEAGHPAAGRMPMYKSWVVNTKKYMKNKKYDKRPIGFMNWGIDPSVSNLAEYMNCGPVEQSIDFLGMGPRLLSVQHCVKPSDLFQNDIIEQYANYSVPSFFLHGCATQRNHNFSEVQTIYGEATTKTFSGGIVQEWLGNSFTGADMGLVEIPGTGNVTERVGYVALRSQLAMVHPSPTLKDQYQPTNTAPAACRPLKWTVEDRNTSTGNLIETRSGESTTILMEAPSARLCACMQDTLDCVYKQENPHNDTMVRTLCSGQWNDFKCRAVYENYTNGAYGAYSMCTGSQQISWILNQDMISHNKDPAVCTSRGGVIQSPLPAKSPSPDCEIFLRQAGADGMGRVTYTPDSDLRNITSPDGGLTTNAKIGIGVGVPIFALTIIAMILIIRRRRSTAAKEPDAQTFGKSELPDTSIQAGPKTGPETDELDGTMKHELEGVTQNELEGTTPNELQGLEMKYDTGEEEPRLHELRTEGNEIFELDGTGKLKWEDKVHI